MKAKPAVCGYPPVYYFFRVWFKGLYPLCNSTTSVVTSVQVPLVVSYTTGQYVGVTTVQYAIILACKLRLA